MERNSASRFSFLALDSALGIAAAFISIGPSLAATADQGFRFNDFAPQKRTIVYPGGGVGGQELYRGQKREPISGPSDDTTTPLLPQQANPPTNTGPVVLPYPGGAMSRSSRPIGLQYGKGTAAAARPSISDIDYPGTGVGASAIAPPPIVNPGTGVGAAAAAPPVIVYPGTGVGAAAAAPPVIVSPGTGVGVATTSSYLSYPAAVGTQGAPIILYPNPAVTTAPGIAGVNTSVGFAPGIHPDGTSIPLASGVSPLSFLDLDSGLRDCEIPFEELEQKSPFCKAQPSGDGRYCQRFSYNQFPEVVVLSIKDSSGLTEVCSGTAIAANWVLTAAHCFVNQSAASEFAPRQGQDYVWSPGKDEAPFVSAVASALNARMLQIDDRQRNADRVIVFGKYGGQSSNPQFTDDLALVHLATPFSLQAVQPATIATDKDIKLTTTIAGYGYSNADGGLFGSFNVAWPQPVTRMAGQFSFDPQDNAKNRSGFCQGDSGGPVFAGRYRGCKPYDIIPENRPRLLEGLISYNMLGAPDEGGSLNQENASRCVHATNMVMQDITTPARRAWICHTTGNQAGGCN
jgi:Trypsin